MISKPKPHYKNQQKELQHEPHLRIKYAMDVNRGTTLTT